MRTPTQALADHLLKRSVREWVRERRAKKISYRLIALELRDVTKGAVDVTDTTIRSWAQPDEDEESDEPRAAAS